MPEFKVISADSHVHDGAEIYDGLPAELKGEASYVEERNGGRYLMQPGQKPVRTDLTAPLLTNEDLRREFRGGQAKSSGAGSRDLAFPISDRLADQDEEGVRAEVVYTNGIFRTFTAPNPKFQNAVAKLYNDYYLDLYKDHSDRIVPAAVIPVADLDFASSELKRVAKMGYRTACLPTAGPPDQPYDRPEYETFWSTAEEAGIPLGFHTQTKAENEIPVSLGEEDSRGTDTSYMSIAIKDSMNPLAHIVASGVLQRHPNLKIVLVESGIGWVAWFLDLMDQLYQRRHMWHVHKLDLLPSEYFKRQCYATFVDDVAGVRNRDITGVDSLMWGNDYPHDEGTFPHSKEVRDRIFQGVPEDEVRKMVGENAAKLYKIPLR